jgi:hypothetical protein
MSCNCPFMLMRRRRGRVFCRRTETAPPVRLSLVNIHPYCLPALSASRHAAGRQLDRQAGQPPSCIACAPQAAHRSKSKWWRRGRAATASKMRSFISGAKKPDPGATLERRLGGPLCRWANLHCDIRWARAARREHDETKFRLRMWRGRSHRTGAGLEGAGGRRRVAPR